MDLPDRIRHAQRQCLLTTFALVLSCVISPAQAHRMLFAHYMVTNQDYQGDTDPTGEAKIAAVPASAAGQRKFNVVINGTQVLTAFDILAAAGGRNRAVSEQFTATANASGRIIIGFSQGGADNPEVNGIEILH